MKDIFLLIFVIILLSFIFFINTKTLENFSDTPKKDYSIKEPQTQKRTNIQDSHDSPPIFYEADDVSQLYRYQRIYPYDGQSDYDVGRFPNVVLPGDVVGCGSRREPCYGGSQVTIGNILPPLDISNKNISPRNGSIGPYPPFQQVGYLYKIMNPYGNNAYRPLYLKRIDPKDRYHKYIYFTINDMGERQNVIIPNEYRELGTNDQVKIEGEDYYFRVTINESNIPTYPRIEVI